AFFLSIVFFFMAPATTEFYTLCLHDALPISTGEFSLAPQLGLRSMRIRVVWYHAFGDALSDAPGTNDTIGVGFGLPIGGPRHTRSEEHTSELQSRSDLVCRLLLEKKKKNKQN